MQPLYAPIQYEDVPTSANADAPAYRISYGVLYDRAAAPHFVYKVEIIENGEVAGDAGLCFPTIDDAEKVAAALCSFIQRPRPL